MKNANFKNPITTGAGIIFLAITCMMFIAPVFWEVKKDFTEDYWYPVGTFTVGLFLVLAPDQLLGIGSRAADKAIGDKKNKE